MKLYYNPNTETAPELIPGDPPVDQTAQVAALTAQVASLTAANAAKQAKIDAAKAALE